MNVYVIISDTLGVPLALYDNFDDAMKYILSNPSIHLCIFEYELNSSKSGKNIYDNMGNKIF
jgi:hypothetical protein